MNVSFYCKKSKVDRQGLAPVMASIIIGGKRTFLNLERRERPDDFSSAMKSKRSNETKEFCELQRQTINRVSMEIMGRGLPLTVDTLREYMKSGGVKSFELGNVIDEYISTLRVTKGTIQKFQVMKKEVGSVIPMTTEMGAITNGQLKKVVAHLTDKYKESTRAGMLIKLKSCFSYAFDNGYIKNNPAAQIKVHRERTEIHYLSQAELNAIESLDLHNIKRLEQVRDLALFQVYGGGMAYCDLVRFNPDNITIENGTYLYKDKRQKTGIPFTTILLPKAIDILMKYDYQLPRISNQRLNAYLKEIQDLAGIKQNITTHLMRKTFATLCLSKNLPITTIQKMLGHSNPIITAKIYAHTEDSVIADQIRTAFA